MYDLYTDSAERARKKAAKREENKRLWAERKKYVKENVAPLAPAGTSPKDDKKRIQMLKDELLTAENGLMVVRKIIHKALNDEDKDQAAMLKLCADRIIPVSMFETAEAKSALGNITIIIGSTHPENEINVIEGESNASQIESAVKVAE